MVHLHQDRQHVLGAHEAAVEEGEAGMVMKSTRIVEISIQAVSPLSTRRRRGGGRCRGSRRGARFLGEGGERAERRKRQARRRAPSAPTGCKSIGKSLNSP